MPTKQKKSTAKKSASVKKAANFVKTCILRSMEMGLPETDGVCFEEVLDQLK